MDTFESRLRDDETDHFRVDCTDTDYLFDDQALKFCSNVLLSTKTLLLGTRKEITNWDMDDREDIYRNSRFDFRLTGVELPGTTISDFELVWRAGSRADNDPSTEDYMTLDEYSILSCREGFIAGIRNYIWSNDGLECLYTLCAIPSKV